MILARRGLIATVIAGVAVAAVIGGTRLLTTRTGDGGSRECGRPSANAAGPDATSPGETYWTEERMRSAEPADPVRERRGSPDCP